MGMNIGESIAHGRRQMMTLRRRRGTPLSGGRKAMVSHIGIYQIHFRRLVAVVQALGVLLRLPVETGRQGQVEGRVGGQLEALGQLLGRHLGVGRWGRGRGIAAATRRRNTQEWTTQLGIGLRIGLHSEKMESLGSALVKVVQNIFLKEQTL